MEQSWQATHTDVLISCCTLSEKNSQVTLIIASYINVIVQREGITSTMAEVNHLVWDLETDAADAKAS